MFSTFIRFLLILCIPCIVCGAQPALRDTRPAQYLIDGKIDCPPDKSPSDILQPYIHALDGETPGAKIHVDYPFDQSVFPPEIVAPTFLWHDPQPEADVWLIKISFERAAAIFVLTSAEQPELNIDPVAVSSANRDYKPPEYDQAAKAWTPASEYWESIKEFSLSHPATVNIYGFNAQSPQRLLSTGQMKLHTSRDPVGAPIFYRDVPLMPSVTGKTIQPLSPEAFDSIAWRLRDISKESGPAVLKEMPTCANCHSFSRDGSVLGMDLDGPNGDKGAYGLTSVEPNTVIDEEDIITWNSYAETPEGHMNFGLFSRVSPDGRYVVSTLNEATYIQNYKDFRFLQSFYPTRGILVVYDQNTKKMTPLPGASSSDYVQANACWSPDGSYLIFSRAPAKDPYDSETASRFAGDERETQIKYDLYRIPFNNGEGGVAVPVKGASKNGMSNSFPKISPDGKWLVFVQSENGQLMRPDSRLYILPVEGGEARELSCNLNPMNSWHSWAPNGKWLVFSSKGFRPFTQMFLTHIDEQGRDTPAVLIPNSTADNRAVNIPEFLNGPGDSIVDISAPTQLSYKYYHEGVDLNNQGDQAGAILKFDQAISHNPYYAPAYRDKGRVLSSMGRQPEAEACLEKALELQPDDDAAHRDMGAVLAARGGLPEAVAYYRKVLETHPGLLLTRGRLAKIYLAQGNKDAFVRECRLLLEYAPNDVETRMLLGLSYFMWQQIDLAAEQFQMVLKVDQDNQQALIYLAYTLMNKNSARAVELTLRAARLSDFRKADVLFALAEACIANGDSATGITYAKQARKIANETGNSDLTRVIDQMLQHYQTQGMPAR